MWLSFLSNFNQNYGNLSSGSPFVACGPITDRLAKLTGALKIFIVNVPELKCLVQLSEVRTDFP
jgi:hypothetical protein